MPRGTHKSYKSKSPVKSAGKRPAAPAVLPATDPRYDAKIEQLNRATAARARIRQIKLNMADTADRAKTLRADLREAEAELARELDAETAPLFATAAQISGGTP